MTKRFLNISRNPSWLALFNPPSVLVKHNYFLWSNRIFLMTEIFWGWNWEGKGVYVRIYHQLQRSTEDHGWIGQPRWPPVGFYREEACPSIQWEASPLTAPTYFLWGTEWCSLAHSMSLGGYQIVKVHEKTLVNVSPLTSPGRELLWGRPWHTPVQLHC